VYHCDKAEKGSFSRDYKWCRRCYLKRAEMHDVATFTRVTSGSMQFDDELFEYVFNNLEVVML
jgi:hypothetical protein